jgi:hypothetical protein
VALKKGMVLTAFQLFMAANILLQLGALACFIALVVEMFSHGETGWGIASIVLLFCGCGQLLAFIYGWTKVGEWEIGLLMLATTLCIVGSMLQVAIMFGTVGFPAG